MSKLSLLIFAVVLSSCAYFSNKTEVLDTQIEKTDKVSSDSAIGSKDGRMIYQEKLLFAEELRKLENEVMLSEDRVYGTRKYNSTGLWGELKSCYAKLAKKQNEKPQKLDPLDRPSEKFKKFDDVGLDPNSDKLIALKEEYLKERFKDLEKTKTSLAEKEDELSEKLTNCKEQLK